MEGHSKGDKSPWVSSKNISLKEERSLDEMSEEVLINLTL
jgi:hypothetical protein